MKYIPDNWVVVKISTKEHGDVYKVLGTWNGSYASPDYWRINSGIEKTTTKDNNSYFIEGYSGSVYEVNIDRCSINALMHTVLSSFADDVKEHGGTFEVFPREDFVNKVTKEFQ